MAYMLYGNPYFLSGADVYNIVMFRNGGDMYQYVYIVINNAD